MSRTAAQAKRRARQWFVVAALAVAGHVILKLARLPLAEVLGGGWVVAAIYCAYWNGWAESRLALDHDRASSLTEGDRNG
jgi:uncharacterized membrane protein AbrB (regulator of aidB expression)